MSLKIFLILNHLAILVRHKYLDKFEVFFKKLKKYYSNIIRSFFKSHHTKRYFKKIKTIIMRFKKVELELFRKRVKMMISHTLNRFPLYFGILKINASLEFRYFLLHFWNCLAETKVLSRVLPCENVPIKSYSDSKFKKIAKNYDFQPISMFLRFYCFQINFKSL